MEKKKELQYFSQEVDFVTIKLEVRMLDVLMEEEVHRLRRVGRRKLRWTEGVREDTRKLFQVRNWKVAPTNRYDWRKKVDRPRFNNEL